MPRDLTQERARLKDADALVDKLDALTPKVAGPVAGGLFRQSGSLNGLGGGGPFFKDPMAA